LIPRLHGCLAGDIVPDLRGRGLLLRREEIDLVIDARDLRALQRARRVRQSGSERHRPRNEKNSARSFHRL